MQISLTCNCTPSNFGLGCFADLALQMLQKDSALALVRNWSNDTGLHILARKPSGFSCPAQNQFMNASKCLQSPLSGISVWFEVMFPVYISCFYF